MGSNDEGPITTKTLAIVLTAQTIALAVALKCYDEQDAGERYSLFIVTVANAYRSFSAISNRPNVQSVLEQASEMLINMELN